MMLRAAGSHAWLLAVAALAAAGTLLVGVPGVAAHPGDTAITITPAETGAGQPVTVSGEGFTAGTSVDLLLRTAAGDQVLASRTVDDEGHFVSEVVLADDLDTRYYEVRAVTSTESASQLVAVTADGGGTADGTDSGSGGPGVLVLVLVGAVILTVVVVVVLRRRRPGTRHQPRRGLSPAEP